MKKFYSIIIVLLIPVIQYADEPFFDNGFSDGAITYVFAQNVRIRTTPEIKEGNVADTLNTGHEVIILNNEKTIFTLNGIRENWVQVKYKLRGKDNKGYVWGALLSISWIKNGNDLVLTGLRKYSETKGLEAECRILRGEKIISSIPVKLHYMPLSDELLYRYSVSMVIHDNKGLTGLENLISINCNFGACGYPYGNVWLGIARDKLYYLAKDTRVSEAGLFNMSEKVVFPSDNKSLKDEVIIVTENYDFDEEINNYRLTEKKERRLKWKNFRLE